MVLDDDEYMMSSYSSPAKNTNNHKHIRSAK